MIGRRAALQELDEHLHMARSGAGEAGAEDDPAQTFVAQVCRAGGANGNGRM